MLSLDHNQPIRSVSEVTTEARTLLEEAYPLIQIEGEVSNFRQPTSGHWYFSLKDDRSQIRCAMFVNRNRSIRQPISDGIHVVIRAKLTLYQTRGDFQAIVEHIEPAGEGALRAAFDRLKTKLSNEGLFDSSVKKPLPSIPRRIVVITSPTSAAFRDIVSVIERRYPVVKLILIPAAVQGAEAEHEIVDALNQLDAMLPAPDVAVLARGGGSIEDLWTFNLETVARGIAASPIPIVSAIGHETDYTISDFVADHRAATPSAASELITPSALELGASINRTRNTLQLFVEAQVLRNRDALSARITRLIHPGRNIQLKSERLNELHQRLGQQTSRSLAKAELSLQYAYQLLQKSNPLSALNFRATTINTLLANISRAVQMKVGGSQDRLQSLARALNAVSPLDTLERGYGIVALPDGTQWGQPISAIDQVSRGETLVAHVADGSIEAEVISTHERAKSDL
ncbi:exodeoxyribonuclease VII large subunit [Gammaproteobacteria bacterium]|nr:exodeoxyribonuclease VII large subunit [Gammaproteobacteria bacterium]